MTEKDTAAKILFQNNEVFADAVNYRVYGGRKVVKPENLHGLDTTQVHMPYGLDDKVAAVQRIRDNFKYISVMADKNAAYAVVAVESQAEPHMAMPVRCMVCDGLEYARQVERTAKMHKKQRDWKGKSDGEYLSGFYKTDNLVPVFTLVVNLSDEPWNGPMSIYDMLQPVDEEVLAMVENYSIHLIDPYTMVDNDFSKMESGLRELLSFIKYSGDEKKMEELLTNDNRFKNLDTKTTNAIRAITNIDVMQNVEKGEDVNMCKAWDDHYKRGVACGEERGEARGLIRGEENGLIKSIISLMESMEWTAEHAMSKLKVASEDYDRILGLLQGQSIS